MRERYVKALRQKDKCNMTIVTDNTFRLAIEEMDKLKSDHDALKEIHTNLRGEHTNLAARFDAITQENTQLRKERDMYQRYAIGLRTRLVTIKEAILSAEQETMSWVTTNGQKDKEPVALEPQDVVNKDKDDVIPPPRIAFGIDKTDDWESRKDNSSKPAPESPTLEDRLSRLAKIGTPR